MTYKDKLTWHTEQRKINDLIPFEDNPRQMSEKQVRDLQKSLERFNLAEIPCIDLDNRICAGHQRLWCYYNSCGRIIEISPFQNDILNMCCPFCGAPPKEIRDLPISAYKKRKGYTRQEDFDEKSIL